MTSPATLSSPNLALRHGLCALLFAAGALVFDARGDDGYTYNLLDPSLSRWVITDCQVECNGEVLTLQEGNGFVRSVHRVRDFTLEWSYRPLQAKNWDSGVYFRADSPPPGKSWPARYQVNLKQGQEGNLVGDPRAAGNHLVKPGEWNSMRLEVVGHRAKLAINGEAAWETERIEPLEGYVGFQVEAPLGGVFEIRDVTLCEHGTRSLFNGQDLTGWEGAGQDAAACWQVTDGLLMCTGAKGPWLRSQQEFDDFNLRLEYKIRAGGNSGVYIRVPADGNHHGEKAGVEIQILDDAAERYRKLKDYQYSASVYAVAPAQARVARPAGEWNTLEIDCRGGSYEISHNGVVAVRADTGSAPELAVRLTRGFFGLQNHSEEVWFRHVRVGPSLQSDDAARPVNELLQRPIIGGQRAQEELLNFTAARVARLPALSTADDWTRYADELRKTVLDRVVYRGAGAQWRAAPHHVEWLETLEPAPEYRIKKLRIEVLPGLWVPALLYEPTQLSGKTPVVLNVNGHDANGKAAPYKQIRCINQAKRGLLALNLEWFGMGQLRTDGFQHGRLNQLELCGTSGLAPFILAMQRGLDVLLEHPHADPQRVAVAGLSGGGWQTIYISALDTRVTLSNPVAGYSSFLTRISHASDLGDSEQTPTDMGAYADYTHFTAMLAPRHALLTFNEKDECCFASGHALAPLLDAARPVYQLFQAEERLRHHVNTDPGTHNFERDNRQALYRALGAAFFPTATDFSAEELECESEVQTADQLLVALPGENQDFHKLALQLATALPRDSAWPTTPADAQAWQTERTMLLERTVRYHGEYQAEARRVATETWRGLDVGYWKIQVAGAWTVPAVELSPAKPAGTAIVFSEAGRSSVGSVVHTWLDRNYRVLAIDPFYWGEQKIAQRDYLYALLIATVGERPLGLQASQAASVARWAQAQWGEVPVELVAVGPRASLAGLVASACEKRAIARLHTHNSLPSLHDVLAQNLAVNHAPEYFCFGLLEHFDIAPLAALAAPREVHFHGLADEQRIPLLPLRDWYQLWHSDFTPVP